MNGGTDQFPLDPSGTPKLVLSVQDAGFDRVGGLPVANANRARTVIGTKAIRRAFPNQAQLDETDHGDGTRTVRIALSERIYSTSVIVSASFLSGWKAGEGGGVVNTVTNSSTLAAPLPIFRWANEPWPLVQGTVGTQNHSARVEVLIASHHPETFANSDGSRHQACAALRLRAFDGTTSKDFFFTAPATSTLYADNLRCWGGDIDLSGLSAGPITVHATVYPWVGAERQTGDAHNTSITAALATAWGAPFHLWYDPDGTIWPRKYLAIDPASPNTTIGDSAQVAAVTLYDSPAAAEAAPLANKAAHYSMALTRISNVAPTMPARNGFSSVARCCAWWEIALPAGTFSHINAVGASTGANAGPGQLIVTAVPSASDPRTNVIFGDSGTERTNGAVDRMKFRGVRVQLGTVAFFSTRTNNWTSYENCDVRSASGGGSAEVYAGTTHVSAMQTDMRDRLVQPRGWFARNVVRTAGMTTANVAAAINVTIAMPGVGETRLPDRTAGAFHAGTTSADDMMLWGCKVYGWRGSLVALATGVFGAAVPLRRLAVVNTLVEAGEVNARILEIGETQNSQLQDSIFEGVTFVGGRFNFHNDANYSGTSGGPAVRVNNSPNTTIILGIPAHGLTTGDTVTIAGFVNANMNRASAVAITVLDANRISYTAGAAVTSVSGNGSEGAVGVGVVTVATGALAGTVYTVRRENLRQTGNVFRYSSFDRNATKHDIFNNAGGLTGSWDLLYGVGFRGNVNANRGTSTPQDFQYAFYGIGADVETGFTSNTLTGVPSYGVNWHGFVDDNSANGPDTGSATYDGDYRADTTTAAPFKPSRLIGKGTAPAVIDRDANNNVRGSTFPGGALGTNLQGVQTAALQPAHGISLHTAEAGRLGWLGVLEAASALNGLIGGTAALTIGDDLPLVSGRLLHVESEASRVRVEPE